MIDHYLLIALKSPPPPSRIGFRRIWTFVPGQKPGWNYLNIIKPININHHIYDPDIVFPGDYHPPIRNYYLEVINKIVFNPELTDPVNAMNYYGQLEPWHWSNTWEMWIPSYVSNSPGNRVNTTVIYLDFLENNTKFVSFIDMETKKQDKDLKNFIFKKIKDQLAFIK